MKSILSLFILIGSFANCIGQSWKPYVLNAKCIYGNKRPDGNLGLINIRYDSVYTSGETAIAYAYTRSFTEDSCLSAAQKEFRFKPFSRYPDELVYPFPIEITQNNDSIISSAYVILTKAHKGQQWEGYTHEKDSMMDILGIQDSVKIYSDQNSGRIVLSKHFGLIQLHGYVLKGFMTDSLSLGLRIPLIETSLTLAPGDILYHRTVKDTSTYPTNGDYLLFADTRDSIISVEIARDTLSIHSIRQEQNFFYPAQSFNNKPITLKYYLPELNNLFQDGSPNQRYDGYYYTKQNVIMDTGANDTVLSVRLHREGYFYNCTFDFMFDICESVSFSSNTIMLASLSCNAIYGGGTQTDLIGSRIGNKVSGHINLGVENTQANLMELTVFPNPTSDLLKLNTSEELDFTIIDMLGNKQMEGKTHQTISMQSLPPGLYILILNSQAATKTFRILRN